MLLGLAILTFCSLYSHDNEIASLFHHSGALRPTASKLAVPCCQEAFDAPDALTWAKVMFTRKPRLPSIRTCLSILSNVTSGSESLRTLLSPPSRYAFTFEILLAAIEAQVWEVYELDKLGSDQIRWPIFTLLLNWYAAYQCDTDSEDMPSASNVQLMCSKIGWHGICLSLAAPLNILEVSIGRSGAALGESVYDEVKAWAKSAQATRAALHASCIYEISLKLPSRLEPPFHVVRQIFQAAIVCYCHLVFNTDLEVTTLAEWPEFTISHLPISQQQNRIRAWSGLRGVLCGLNDILLSIGHGGMAQRLAEISSILVEVKMGIQK